MTLTLYTVCSKRAFDGALSQQSPVYECQVYCKTGVKYRAILECIKIRAVLTFITSRAATSTATSAHFFTTNSGMKARTQILREEKPANTIPAPRMQLYPIRNKTIFVMLP